MGAAEGSGQSRNAAGLSLPKPPFLPEIPAVEEASVEQRNGLVATDIWSLRHFVNFFPAF